MGLTPLEKSQRRRFFAGALDNSRASDAELLALCKDASEAAAKSQDKHASQSTLAFGVFEAGGYKIILAAWQSGGTFEPKLMPGKSPLYSTYELRFVSTSMQTPGLHAEMMIMRSLMLENVIDPQKIQESARAINLRIVCPVKKCCPDCSGWLRKYGIPHYPVDAGSTSPNWVHPRTGACFRVANGDVSYYHKLGNQAANLPEVVVGEPIGVGNIRPIKNVSW